MANICTHYDNLKVARDAPISVIKAAYKALCQSYHPDKYQDSNEEAERIMKLVNASYVELIDPVKRAIHDDWILKQEAEATEQNQQSHSTTAKAPQEQWREKWHKAGEQFHNQKQNTQQEYTPPPTESKQSKGSTPTYTWRRYFARSFIDYGISGLLLGLVFGFWLAIGHRLPNWITAALFNPELPPVQQQVNWGFFSAFLWVILEPIILANFGTTPGKVLFRLRLVSDNNKPNYLGRSVAVWAAGMGFGTPILSFFTMLNAATRLKKKGKTDWDRWMGFSVEAEPLSIIRKGVLTMLLVSLIMANAIIGRIDNKITPNQEPRQQVQAQQTTTSSTNSSTNQFDRIAEEIDNGTYKPPPQSATPSSTNSAEVISQRADELFNQGQNAEALPLYQNLAEQGNSFAQNRLGYMYSTGQGVAQNYTQAVYWYRIAAEQGDANAQYNLGGRYATGQGITQNDNQAVFWFRKAAEQGEENAIAALNKLSR